MMVVSAENHTFAFSGQHGKLHALMGRQSSNVFQTAFPFADRYKISVILQTVKQNPLLFVKRCTGAYKIRFSNSGIPGTYRINLI